LKVYLAQLKCPKNHCLLAAAGEYETPEAAQALIANVRRGFIALVVSGQANYECGLCHAKEFHVDVNPTVYATLDEARPALRAEERKMAVHYLTSRMSRN
jgi:hypothetical protein